MKDLLTEKSGSLASARARILTESGAHPRPRPFYGWWVVLASALGLFLGPIPICIFSFGVFLRSLSHEFHAGRAAISFAYTLFTLMGALWSPFAGRLVDRFGARRVILPSLVILGSILISSQLLSGKIWQLYVFYSLLGMITCGAGPVPYSKVISHWFDRYRGLALGLTMFGLGSGALIMPPLAQHLIARFGWRFAYGIVGAAIVLVSAPVVGILLRDRPERMDLLPDGASLSQIARAGADTDPGMSWHEARHTRTFWLLLAAFVLVAASVQGCFVHMAALLSDLGSTAQAAALAVSVVGGGVLVGRVGTGYLLDRFFAPRIAALIFGGAAIGIALLLTARELHLTAAFLIGLGLGAEVDIIAYLTSRYFGLRSFGQIYGFCFSGFGAAGGVGVYLTGAAFDARGTYTLPLTLFFISILIAVILMMRLGPYQYQAIQSGEDK
jgi:MFS family permease